ncbi:MAG: ImmA/IrrE family metallo-endopeptidase, partial [Actinobacteria bacterium]|nr:ImmA/IrrE family metallo-endopeptidase [Actinomycetota bacterium]
QLEDFARKTYTPIGFLFLDEPPVEEVPIPDFRTIRHTPVGGPTGRVSANLLDTVYVCQARQEWYRDNQLLNGESPLQFVGSATLSSPIVEVAEQMSQVLDWSPEIRRRLSSWDLALTRLRENAEIAGVLVMISGIAGSNTRRKLDPEEFRGFALADPHAALVFVNGADSKPAQIFTLAHELAHLWLGQTALSDVVPESARSYDEERWCNRVAAELLVPMEEFELALDDGSDIGAQLQPLAERFRVSTQVILGRMREIGALSWDQFMVELRIENERVAETISRRGSGGNYYNTKPVQVGKRFAREVIASTLEGRTTYTEAFRLLDVKKTSTLHGLGKQLGVL